MNKRLFSRTVALAAIASLSIASANAQTTTADTTVGTSSGANNTLNLGGSGPQTSKATAYGFGPLAQAPGLPQATLCVTSDSKAMGILFGAYSDGSSNQKVREFCEYQDQWAALIRGCKFSTAAKLQQQFMFKVSGIEMEIHPDDKDLSMKECLKPTPVAPPPAPEPKIVTVEKIVEVPVERPSTPAVKKISLAADALFDFDKSELKASGTAALDKLVDDLKDVDLASIVVVGHTDSRGSDSYNMKLSERRAKSVTNYLVKKGVFYSKLVAFGKGESEPIADNSTDAGREKNRRVEIQTIGVK